MLHADMTAANDKNAISFHSKFPLSMCVFLDFDYMLTQFIPIRKSDIAESGGKIEGGFLLRIYKIFVEKLLDIG